MRHIYCLAASNVSTPEYFTLSRVAASEGWRTAALEDAASDVPGPQARAADVSTGISCSGVAEQSHDIGLSVQIL
jgi:hypothetical protein